MIEFGETLRKTREQKGLTTSQVAQTTHLLVQQIEALEREDFSKIAAPIYGRGFVKLYCEALGLDPKPFVEEFMAIYTGSKLRPIRMRTPAAQTAAIPPVAAQPVPAPMADAPTVAIPPPQDEAPTVAAPVPDAAEPATMETEALDPSCFNFARTDDIPPPVLTPNADFALESEPVRMAQAHRAPAQKSAGHVQPSFRPPTKLDHFNDKPQRRGVLDMVPPAAWRILVLGIVGLLVLWGVFAGIRTLYRASMGPNEQRKEQTATDEQQTPTPTPNAADVQTRPQARQDKNAVAPRPTRSNRKPLPVPPLYID